MNEGSVIAVAVPPGMIMYSVLSFSFSLVDSNLACGCTYLAANHFESSFTIHCLSYYSLAASLRICSSKPLSDFILSSSGSSTVRRACHFP